MTTKKRILPDEFPPTRLDQALADEFPELSRTQLQGYIKSGLVFVNGDKVLKQRLHVQAGDTIEFTPTEQANERWLPQDIPIDIVYEDDELLIVNKASPMVVHPGAGVYDNTLVNALLHYCKPLEFLPRAGLIHRLDKETTGLLVVAKTRPSFAALTKAMQAREVKRHYQAVVQGPIISGGSIDASLGRHPKARTKISVLQHGGRAALTHYRILTRYRYHTHLRLQLETGRTHQIRVHLQHIRHPIVGDPVYSRLKVPKDGTDELRDVLQNFKRQALHACELGLTHPTSGEEMHWTAPLPADFSELVLALNNNEKMGE